jgi:hypothetical protein
VGCTGTCPQPISLTGDGSFCGVVDFGDVCGRSGMQPRRLLNAPARRIRQLFPRNAVRRLTRRCGAVLAMGVDQELACLIGNNGVRGRPGGKATWDLRQRQLLQRDANTSASPKPGRALEHRRCSSGALALREFIIDRVRQGAPTFVGNWYDRLDRLGKRELFTW